MTTLRSVAVALASLALGACNAQFRFDPLPSLDGSAGVDATPPTVGCFDADGGDLCVHGYVCDKVTDECRELCDDPNDCAPAAPLCDLVRGVCVVCLTSADCPSGKRCEESTHDCM